jgi:transcriptional regulator with XRE-family HTH domain
MGWPVTHREARPEPQQLIRRYLKERKMSNAELARAVNISESYVSRIQRDRTTAPELAVKLADALGFSDEDLDAFFDALGMASAPAAFYRVEVERRWRDILRDQLRADSFLRQLGNRPYFLAEWARARLSLGFFDMRRAVPQMELVVRKAANTDPELRSIVLLDMADAYAIAGRLSEARALAQASESLCRSLLEHGRSARVIMGVARALVMQQEIAYEAGDETACWQYYERALDYLGPAEDAYGLAKSLFFLALFRFWQGQLDEAEGLAREAMGWAAAIRFQPDLWWAWRDGFFLASHWWRVHTEALVLDVLSCAGRPTTPAFSELRATHRRDHGLLPWTRDFPPFSPRYAWLLRSGAATETASPASEEDRRYRNWIQETRTLGLWHLHTDLLIAQGDFLRFGAKEEVRARAAYRAAAKLATERGYGLFARLAQERLAGRVAGFPGLTRF